MPLSSILRPGLIAVLLSLLFGLLQTARAYGIYPSSNSFDDPKGGTINTVTLKDPKATFVLSPMVANWDYTGAMPIKVKITNNLDRDKTWIFHSQTTTGQTIHSFPVSVPARSTTEKIVQLPPISLTLPYPAIYSEELTIEGLSPATNPDLPLFQQYPRREHNERAVLLDPAIDKAKVVSQFASSSFSENINRIHLDQWPADPMAYFVFSGIYLKEKTWEALDSARKDALRQWTNAGGCLWILREDATAKKSDLILTGDGKIQYMPEDYKQLAQSIENKKGELEINRIFPPQPYDAAYRLYNPRWFIILVLLSFAALVGPVSLFCWAPAGKRQRLFYLVPAISLSCSLVLALFILISEGFGGKGRRTVRIVLTPESHMAIVKQTQVCITGILTDTSFPLDDKIACYWESSISPIQGQGLHSSEKYLQRQNNMADGSYFSSRVELSHRLMAFTPTRARLTLSDEQGVPAILSTWPTSLKNFLYTDDKGVTWETDTVSPGQKTALRKHIPQDKKEAVNEESGEETAALPRKGNFLATAAPSELAPIPTHPGIVWERELIELTGPVTRELSAPQPSR